MGAIERTEIFSGFAVLRGDARGLMGRSDGAAKPLRVADTLEILYQNPTLRIDA
jgi:hypothetical protein